MKALATVSEQILRIGITLRHILRIGQCMSTHMTCRRNYLKVCITLP